MDNIEDMEFHLEELAENQKSIPDELLLKLSREAPPGYVHDPTEMCWRYLKIDLRVLD